MYTITQETNRNKLTIDFSFLLRIKKNQRHIDFYTHIHTKIEKERNIQAFIEIIETKTTKANILYIFPIRQTQEPDSLSLYF